jgi:hypothetical protein
MWVSKSIVHLNAKRTETHTLANALEVHAAAVQLAPTRGRPVLADLRTVGRGVGADKEERAFYASY